MILSNTNISSGKRTLIVIAVMSATLMQVLDMTIVNVALPYMQGSLSASSDQISWTLTCYLVASAVFMPLTGYLADIFGQKKYLLFCIFGFTCTSALCGAAESLTQIVIFRLLQGMFGAGLVPLSQTILTDVYPKKDLGKAMAIWSAGIMVGPILGPTLGGYLTEIANWRWTFYINLPVGLLALLLAWRVVPESQQKKRQMDWVGLAFISLAIGSLQYILDRGNQEDWFNSSNIKIAVFGIFIGFFGFIIRNMQATKAVFDIRIFNDRNFTIASLILIILGVALFGTLILQPLLLEGFLGYPVLSAGLAMAPRGLCCFISIMLIGKLNNRIDPRLSIAVGIILTSLGMFIGTFYSQEIDLFWAILPLVFQGFGMGMIFVPLTVVAFSTLPHNLKMEATGLFSLIRTIGSSIGIAVTLTLFTRHNQVGWNQLGGFVQPYNQNLMLYLNSMHAKLTDPHTIQILAQEVSRQAQMLSFVNIFAFMMWSLIFMLPLVLLLRYEKIEGQELPHASLE